MNLRKTLVSVILVCACADSIAIELGASVPGSATLDLALRKFVFPMEDTGLWYHCKGSGGGGLSGTVYNTYDGKVCDLQFGKDTQCGATNLYSDGKRVYVVIKNDASSPRTLTCDSWGYGVSYSRVTNQIAAVEAAKTCSANVSSLDSGRIFPGLSRSIMLPVTTSGNGRVTFTGNDIGENGVLSIDNPQLTITPVNAKNMGRYSWLSSPGDTGISLNLKTNAMTGAGQFTSYLTATLTCD
ncbi:hypothetical protein SAMN05192562_102439 [Kosakonia arachidis]|uniref:Fimbrial protein n=1 Tax=Kosakonia arachidis TaxID=551989 RepID=A0A1I7BB76_9ENTR|nr:hypothetical protein [Kosakonia arachidis]SFT84408.1 hypothetical protein SAMN05192562_102439 [Kosakonia arachidis]